MIVTLYIFSHKHTKLKYFGKTTKSGSDFDKYFGSGTHWRSHLKKHGRFIEREIYAKYEHNDHELQRVALEFSELNDIVISKEWANIIQENGLDGSLSGELHHFYGSKHSDETLKKMSEAKKGKTNTEEHKKKISESRKGFKHTNESKEKMKMQRKNLPNIKCPHCGKEGHQMPMKQWHFNNCKLREN